MERITVEPRFYDRRFNDISDLTINLLRPGKSCSKLYGAESQQQQYSVQRYSQYNHENLATQA